MSQATVASTHLSEIPSLSEDEGWKPVRHHFGIGSFGVNAYVAKSDGEQIVEPHDEVEHSGTRHEELFFVPEGRATFTVGEETFEAPAGTFVYVRDPAVTRGAVAESAGTTVLAIGGEPGVAYEVSPWERKYID
jgi:hypothetical protein